MRVCKTNKELTSPKTLTIVGPFLGPIFISPTLKTGQQRASPLRAVLVRFLLRRLRVPHYCLQRRVHGSAVFESKSDAQVYPQSFRSNFDRPKWRVAFCGPDINRCKLDQSALAHLASRNQPYFANLRVSAVPPSHRDVLLLGDFLCDDLRGPR